MTELPTTFGKYFLTEKLATGGMAEIYLAKLVGPGGFEKPLVIKQIHPKLSGQRHFVDLFVAEAKILVGLAHGNIVPVYELGVIDDTYFIAMEYIDGPTLYRLTEAVSRKDRMEPAVAAWITAKILEGLDYAHRKGEGVIHRDLSPRNVMLSRDGEVKLVDFGIAVTLGAVEDNEAQSAPTGSFPYMSPEQVRREPLTGQTDLFSVGVLMWEMLVGSRLFARPDADETLAAVTEGPIARPSKEVPAIPSKLDEVVMRALERDMTARWGSAAEMLGALQKYLYSLDVTPGPRDVAALVAKFCPPETRRLPTHADATPAPNDDGTPPPAGPRTAVIDRPDAAPRGKGRARTETFATHVELEHMLQRATPLIGVDALTDADLRAPRTKRPAPDQAPGTLDEDPDRDPTPVPPPEPLAGDDDDDASASALRIAASARVSARDIEPTASMRLRATRSDDTSPNAGEPVTRVAGESRPRMRSVRPDSDAPIERPDAETPNLPGREPPNRALLVFAAVGTVAIGIGAIYVFKRGRSSVLRPDAAVKYDAPFYMFEPDAPPDTTPVSIDDASPEPDTVMDGPAVAPPADARVLVEPPPDARIARPKPDAAVAITPDAAVVTGTAKLTIGANPWGDIVIDGQPRGRTPKAIDVPAGKHTVEITFSGEDRPVKKTFPIDVAAGQTLPIHAEFK
jgi:serine/threonine-protein kinase